MPAFPPPEGWSAPPSGCSRPCSAEQLRQRFTAARERHRAGTHDFENADRFNQIDKGPDFLALTGHFEDIGFRADIDDITAEDIGDPQDLRALLRFRPDFDQDQLPFDEVFAAEVD